MFNTHKPNLSELPTSEQLARSTATAGIVAIAILFTIVLPAEYGIDPTGIGGMIGLKNMGEIKQSLAAEARQQDIAKALIEEGSNEEVEEREEVGGSRLAAQIIDDMPLALVEAGSSKELSDAEKVSEEGLSDQVVDDTPKSETMTVTIAPNGYLEIKAKMLKKDKIKYSWTAKGGALNYNVHGEPTGGGSAYEYDKGLNKTSKDGKITAVFDGTHGWFWRNRSGQSITLTITVDGEFSALIEA